MWTPWKNKTGLAKAAAILATTLSIATASCGINFVLVLNSSGGLDSPMMSALFAAGWVELSVMGASLLGLLVVFVMSLVSNRENKKDVEGGD